MKRTCILVDWKKGNSTKHEPGLKVYSSLAVFAKATEYTYSRDKIKKAMQKAPFYSNMDLTLWRVPYLAKVLPDYKDH